MNAYESDRTLRIEEVCQISGLTRPTIHRLEAASLFPPRRRIGVGRVGWLQMKSTGG
jgi:predicted DNA-binding transcriptional regulator AlpA